MVRAPIRLSMKAVRRSFRGGAGLARVDLTVEAGEVVCLLGPSGCGKSTTLRIAAGVERADSGEVHVDSVLVQGPGVFVPPERRRVGLIFQDFALFPHLTVLQNVAFGLNALPRAQARSLALSMLERVGLKARAFTYPHVLSGGEQQRVALARALAPQPGLMLMDEPFSGLDERLREDIRESTVALLKGLGAAILIVTHDPFEAMLLADRIALMRAGTIVQTATPQEIYSQPADAEAAAFFSQHQVLEGEVKGGFAQTVAGPVAAPFKDGERVDVLVRPEAIVLGDGPGRARVLRVKPIGPHTLADLSLEAAGHSQGLVLKCRLYDDHIPSEGAVVSFRLHPRRTLVFLRAG